MSDETTKPAAKPAAGVTQADLAAAVATAMRESALNRFGPPSEGPTARVKAAADAIKRGKGVRAAMAEAGYGRRYIDGHAAGFPAFLLAAGLLSEAQATKATGEVLAGGGA